MDGEWFYFLNKNWVWAHCYTGGMYSQQSMLNPTQKLRAPNRVKNSSTTHKPQRMPLLVSLHLFLCTTFVFRFSFVNEQEAIGRSAEWFHVTIKDYKCRIVPFLMTALPHYSQEVGFNFKTQIRIVTTISYHLLSAR